MATTSDPRNPAGGKMVRIRRVPSYSRIPYARPERLPKKAPIEDHENPNWLSGLIYPAKVFASGAGKVFSFFGPDSSSSSSFSGDDTSENDEEDEVENDISSQQDDRSNKSTCTWQSIPDVRHIRPLLNSHKLKVPSSSSKNKKLAIEQLLTQETFSREEGNDLIKLIKSRMVDANENYDENAANICTTSIMEARKCFQQKMSSSKKRTENEFDFTNLATSSQDAGNEMGSPVDVAKSYMQNRPGWASPSVDHSEFGSPSLFGSIHFKEDTPKSTLFSSEMKRNYLSSPTRNIFEEIQKVRSKAAEVLRPATPLTKTCLSSFSPGSDPPQSSLMNEKRKDLESNEDNRGNDLRTAAENDFPSTVCSVAARQDATLNTRPPEEENRNTFGPTLEGLNVHIEDPHTNPPDNVVNGSQNSSSIGLEEPLPIKERTPMIKAKDERRENKSRGVYTRRGRRRGK